MADLSIDFAGIKSPNPFWLASAPPANSGEQIMRAFDAGWGGAVKTLGDPIMNVTSRFGGVDYDGRKLMGLNNIELITDRPLEVSRAQRTTDRTGRNAATTAVCDLVVGRLSEGPRRPVQGAVARHARGRSGLDREETARVADVRKAERRLLRTGSRRRPATDLSEHRRLCRNTRAAPVRHARNSRRRGLSCFAMGLIKDPTARDGESRPPSSVRSGRRCEECGSAALIRVDGCDRCTVCGAIGVCG